MTTTFPPPPPSDPSARVRAAVAAMTTNPSPTLAVRRRLDTGTTAVVTVVGRA